MADTRKTDTRYGENSRYDVIRREGILLGEAKYFVHKDGEPHRGSFDSRKDAVRAAEEESRGKRS